MDETRIGLMVPAADAVNCWESQADTVRAMPADAAMRWAALLNGTQTELDGLAALKFSTETAHNINYFLTSGLDLANTDLVTLSDRRFRELARRCPKGRTVNDLLVFAAGIRSGGNQPTSDVDTATDRLAQLRHREPDFDWDLYT